MKLISKWEKPKTIKLYLHPPASSRLVTMWPDFKVVNAYVEQVPARKEQNMGLRILFGEKASVPDWEKTTFRVRQDAIPVYTMKTGYQNFVFNLEGSCSWDENPVIFIKLDIKNNNPSRKRLIFGVMPRTGRDSLLYGISEDFYTSFHPLLEHWDMIKNSWALNGSLLQDGDRKILFSSTGKINFKWVKQNKGNMFARNYLELSSDIEKNGIQTFYFVFGEKINMSPSRENYNQGISDIIARWQAEQNKIKVTPNISDKNVKTMFYSLVNQSLQMFARGNDGLVRARQGGRYWGVWPTEVVEYFRALDRIGLHEWPGKGYEYFLHHQIKEGEDRGRFISVDSSLWGNISGAVLYGLSYHLMSRNDENYFLSLRDAMLSALEWIEKQRDKTKEDPPGIGYGFFPAMGSHDWGDQGQSWCFTDGYNYLGMKEMVKAFAYFKDPVANSIRDKVADYEKCFKRTLEKLYEPQKKRDSVFITNILGREETYPPVGPYFCDGPAMLIRAGIIEAKSEIFKKVENYFRKKGWMKNGLTGLMTDGLMQFEYFRAQSDPWAGHTWYTSFSDMCWFHAWLKNGQRNKAKKTLLAQIKYSMTKEFYMQERYADNDPTFCPWQPNGSANGRTIMMLLDFYGQKTVLATDPPRRADVYRYLPLKHRDTGEGCP